MSDAGVIIFLGASASRSHIHKFFAAWAWLAGGCNARLLSHDMPARVSESEYVAFVLRALADPQITGVVVTNHKVGIYDAFTRLGLPVSAECTKLRAVGVFRRSSDGFEGDADGVRSSMRAIEALSAARGVQQFSEAIVLGGGGAGRAVALGLSLRHAAHSLTRITISDTSPERIRELERIVPLWASPVPISLVRSRGWRVNDLLLAQAEAGALVVNATGIGKDRDGSPVSDHARFPSGCAAWDLNYRGRLVFLEQALAQRDARCSVHDGMDGFVSSWMECLAFIFSREPSAALLQQFHEAM